MQVDAAQGEKIKRQGVILSKTIMIFKREMAEMCMIKWEG